MKDGKFQIGVIGCGGIAGQKHFPALTFYSDDCHIAAVCDIIEERAAAAAEKYARGARVYADYRQLLGDETIDMVYVLTPNVSHSQITVDAFEAGKHVFCEKPMSHSSAEAQRMLDAWKKSGRQFTVGYQNRFRPEIQTIHRACEAGELGDIYFAKAHAIRRRAVPTWGVFMDKEKQGGGPLIDIGTHALDLALWNMDNYRPKSVTGSVFHRMADKFEGNQFGPWDPEKYDVEDSAFGFIKMENGATVFLEASWVLNVTEYKEACVTLCGTEAGAEIVDCRGPEGTAKFNTAKNGELVSIRPDSGGPVAFFDGVNEGAAHFREAKQWLEAVRNGRPPLVKPEQAFVVTQILEAIYRSAETGKTVELSSSKLLK